MKVIAPAYRNELREDPDCPEAAMAEAVCVKFSNVPWALAPEWLETFGKDDIQFEANELSVLFNHDANGVATTADVYINANRIQIALGALAPFRAPRMVCETIQTGKGGVAHFWVER